MLLKKMNKLTQVLQNEGGAIDFSDLSATLRDCIGDCSVYIISRKGKVLGYALVGDFESTPFDAEWIGTGVMPGDIANGLLKVGAMSYGNDAAKVVEGQNSIIVPVVGSGRRVGTLLVVRDPAGAEFGLDDFVLSEYASTAVGMVISYAIDEEEEDEAEERRMAHSAIRSLSYSEILAMQHIFDELNGDEGLLVASRVADQAGITRSVIVNALRKLASANVIESRSLGMKGTYLRILNKEIRNELDRQRYPYLNSGPRNG
ncbi:MAG TPA: GTP-sensing pleiotropic transcriptional regulator CodY [Firmicutes bacterium]|jgi:transcriptional pleiotropic repressor|nr:GTP-sensing pleiotropic transcriptional regulator CodY [Bacillota bacterium]